MSIQTTQIKLLASALGLNRAISQKLLRLAASLYLKVALIAGCAAVLRQKMQPGIPTYRGNELTGPAR